MKREVIAYSVGRIFVAGIEIIVGTVTLLY